MLLSGFYPGIDLAKQATFVAGVCTGPHPRCHIDFLHDQLLTPRYAKPRNAKLVRLGYAHRSERELGADFAGYRSSAKAALSCTSWRPFFRYWV
ncbi:hypothetical protein VARIO8X_120120 [Burkholderiales bacterium 8X]|nr:hypothetical protein VARIO8X_120120 [Burkholderiales bacterium 8X]